MKNRTMNSRKIEFSANYILAGCFFINLSGDIFDHHTALPSFLLRFAKRGRLKCG